MSDKFSHRSRYNSDSHSSSYLKNSHRSRSRERSDSDYKSYDKRNHCDRTRLRTRSRSRSRDRYMSDYKRYNRRSDNHASSRSKRSRSRSQRRSHMRRHSRSRSRTRNRRSRSNSREEAREFLSESSKYRNSISTTEAKANCEVLNHQTDIVEQPMQSVFKNDGSFLEMFKKMQEQSTSNTEQTENNKIIPVIGKRRGGKVLKTGIVEKVKVNEENEDSNKAKDPWSIYINEVKKYRQASCQDEGKTRSLVK